jgi:hypothetical protein
MTVPLGRCCETNSPSASTNQPELSGGWESMVRTTYHRIFGVIVTYPILRFLEYMCVVLVFDPGAHDELYIRYPPVREPQIWI